MRKITITTKIIYSTSAMTEHGLQSRQKKKIKLDRKKQHNKRVQAVAISI